jgi:predicted transcriptional regulator
MAKTKTPAADPLVSLLQQRRDGSAKGHSQRELRELTGLGKVQLQSRLERLHEAGRLRCARKLVPCIDGTLRNVPTYWVE